MRVIYDRGSGEPVAFAASELTRYLEQMLREPLEDDWELHLEIAGQPEKKRRGVDEAVSGRIREAPSVTDAEKAGARVRDGFRIRTGERGGVISGNNARSVLLGVYDYLHYLGCRFLLPKKEGECIPRIGRERLGADYAREASFYHRGVCIEGADSPENIMDYIDWLPKVGYNSFFLQFKVPYAFLERWYHHRENPFREPEHFTGSDARVWMERLEKEIKKRGLMLHKVGHGWTGEVLGYETASWDEAGETAEPESLKLAAKIGGVRGLYQGIPADTNLCYHSEEAIDIFAEKVVRYAAENPQVDYLHIWLADEYNNVCECESCVRTTISDQYVSLLNEIDRRLSKKGLGTRLVFLLYQELLWPPVKERLANPDRFVLMFAPISRTFGESYSLENIPKELPRYVRNRIELPSVLGENLAYLRGWQKIFHGDSFVYDYPLGRAHYGDFGYVHISEIISGDIKKLREMGLDGYISCQELRAALPNALPNYIMGYTLFSEDADPRILEKEYFEAAYGEAARETEAYLRRLSGLECCDYLNGKGSRTDPETARKMKEILECCREFPKKKEGVTAPSQAEKKADTEWAKRAEELFWRLLTYHREYIVRLAEAVYDLASGEKEKAALKWSEMRKWICGGEEEFQPYLDVYRVLEVTQKYTGLGPQNQQEEWHET